MLEVSVQEERYAKLISRFKGVDFPGTGMSIGVDRIVICNNAIRSD